MPLEKLKDASLYVNVMFRVYITWNQRKIYIITLFLERIKVVGYILFILMFFVVGSVKKGIELKNM